MSQERENQPRSFGPAYVKVFLNPQNEKYIQDQGLRDLVKTLDQLPPQMVTPDLLKNQVSHIAQEQIRNPIYNQKDLQNVSNLLGFWAGQIQPGQNVEAQEQPVSLGVNDMARAVALGYSSVMEASEMPKGKDYEAFLNTEEHNKLQTPIFDRGPYPGYWREMSSEAQRMLNTRRELNNLVFAKRKFVSDFESYGKLDEVNSIQTSEVAALYKKMPGFRKALEVYADLFFNPNGEGNKLSRPVVEKEGNVIMKKISIRDAKTGYGVDNVQDDGDAEAFRSLVRNRVARHFQELSGAPGILPNEVVIKAAREAEQAVMNLGYGTNMFESWLLLWEGDTLDAKKFKTSYNGVFFSGGIVDSLYPLIAAISKGTKGEYHSGKHHPWVKAQCLRLKEEEGGNLKYDAIQIVEADNKWDAKDTFWKIKREVKITRRGPKEKLTLQVPEVYPRKLLIESPWERNKIKTDGNDKTLTDFLREGEEIPWDLLTEAEFTGGYSRDGKKAQTILNSNLTVQSSKPGENWVADLDKALDKFPQYRKDLDRLRYIFTKRIYPDSNIPYMEGEYGEKLAEVLIARDQTKDFDFFRFVEGSSGKTNMLFPWDNVKTKAVSRRSI